MKESFEHCKVFLTPLAPVQIGSGEDFEYVNFVADKGLLYSFDPARVPLSATELKRLGDAAQVKDCGCAIQKLYRANLEKYKNASTAISPFDKYAADGVNGLQEGNPKVQISRTVTVLSKGIRHPYIPGSSVKGAIRTAVFNAESEGKRSPENVKKGFATDLDAYLFNDNMNFSPFSRLKIGDMKASEGAGVYTRIVKAERIHKKDDPVANAKSIARAFFEVIEKAQYRSFEGEISLNLKSGSARPLPFKDPHSLLRSVHRYYSGLFNKEKAIWEQGEPGSKYWIRTLQSLILRMKNSFEQGEAALIRIGRNSGAEAMTISDWAKIKIQHHKTKTVEVGRETTSHFVAYEEEREGKLAVLPFGWCVLELDPVLDQPALKKWCTEVRNRDKFAGFDLVENQESLRKAYEEDARKMRELLEEEEKKAALLKKEEENKLKLQQELREKYKDLPENQRKIYELMDEIIEDPVGLGRPDLHLRHDKLKAELQKSSPSDFLLFLNETIKLKKRREERWPAKKE